MDRSSLEAVKALTLETRFSLDKVDLALKRIPYHTCGERITEAGIPPRGTESSTIAHFETLSQCPFHFEFHTVEATTGISGTVGFRLYFKASRSIGSSLGVKRPRGAASQANSASKLVIWCLPAANAFGGSITDTLFYMRLSFERGGPESCPAAGGE